MAKQVGAHLVWVRAAWENTKEKEWISSSDLQRQVLASVHPRTAKGFLQQTRTSSSMWH